LCAGLGCDESSRTGLVRRRGRTPLSACGRSRSRPQPTDAVGIRHAHAPVEWLGEEAPSKEKVVATATLCNLESAESTGVNRR
jgi:hypothetical protein